MMSDKHPVPTVIDLQGQLPPHLARSDLAELAVLMRHADQGAWAFAIYNTVPVRDEVAEVLRELLAPLPVYTFTLSSKLPNPLTYLEKIPADVARAIAFFFDLEQTEGQTWHYLELQRENLAARPLSLIFWITPQARGEGVRTAPNFWSQRSGVFDFTIESPQVLSEVRGAWAGQPVRLDTPDDWERQMRLFSGLLREYELENAPPAALAGLHSKIAYLFHFADRNEEANQHLQQQLALAQLADDRRQQVEAMNNLGRIAQLQHGRQAALDWYEQALLLARDDPPARAESLQNIAAAIFSQGEAGQAMNMLIEALDLFRQVGDRLGEANTLKAIGNFQLDQGEGEIGLQTMEQALELYQQIGDRSGQANICWSLGLRLAQQGYLTDAEPLIAQAVDLSNQFAPGHPVTVQMETVLAQIRAQLAPD